MKSYLVWLITIFAINSSISANFKDKDASQVRELRLVFYNQIFEKQYEKEFAVAVKLWLQEIVNNVDESYTAIVRNVSSYDELKELYDKDKLDMLVVLSTDYLNINRNIPIEPKYVALSNGEVLHSYVLLGQKNKGNTITSGFTDSKIIIPENNWGYLGKYWFEYFLKEKKLKYNFPVVKYKNSIKDESQAILSVFFNNNDYCVVRKSSFEIAKELNPQIGKKLVILEESEPLLHSAFCTTDRTPDEKINILHKILSNTEGRARLNQIMGLFKHEKLVPYKKEFMISIKKIAESNSKSGGNRSSK